MGSYRSVVLAALVAAAGCSVDSRANPGANRCGPDRPCATGVCHRGFCVGAAAMDGGGCSPAGSTRGCYTGSDPTTEGRGECRGGEQECGTEGVFGACLGEVLPTTEADCTMADEDCDGRVDEFLDPACEETTREGDCRSGTRACMGMKVVCTQTVFPEPEACNGEDDDCDGMIDEGTDEACYPEMTDGCTFTDGRYECRGICIPGMQVCMGGMLQPCAGQTVPRAGMDDCTTSGVAMDDDCDGRTDEDCVCVIAGTQDCYGGPAGTEDVGICRGGTQTCAMTPMGPRFGTCAGETLPHTESCADEGTDDDCNGTADDVAGRGDPCTVMPEMRGVCASGTLQCTGGAGLVCVGPGPRTEICDGLDDDCDGMSDEDFDLFRDEANCGTCGRACGEGLTCCGGACVDTRADEANCGECGMPCGAGRECCTGACFDTQTDPDHCGTCGAPCGGGRACCGGSCTDTTQDETHCGMCDMGCGPMQQCCGSTCASPSAPACTSCTEDCAAMGLTCCIPSCADTMNDPANCGVCGRTCDAGDLCCGGECVPNDIAHCGTCGTACAGGSPLCCSSACVPSDAANCNTCGNACPSGQSCCPDGCHDLGSDEANCGACGEDCATGQTCSSGLCCPMGQTNCGGTCVNTSTDLAHCGGCFDACSGGVSCACSGGRCTGLLCS